MPLEHQVNTHWQCSLEEKEAGHPVVHPIGEPEAQAQGQQDRDLAKIENHAIKLQSIL